MSTLEGVYPIPSKRVKASSVLLMVTIVILALATVWLYIEVGRITQPIYLVEMDTLASRVEDNTSNLIHLSENLDSHSEQILMLNNSVSANSNSIINLSGEIGSLAFELSNVAALAENANMYAHSHGWSDERLKRDVLPISDTLDRVLLLQGVTFYWDRSLEMALPDSPQIGFIAQDVEEIYPELVTVDENGYKVIDYSKFSPILVEAIKEQQQQILALQQQYQELESELSEINKVVQEQCKP